MVLIELNTRSGPPPESSSWCDDGDNNHHHYDGKNTNTHQDADQEPSWSFIRKCSTDKTLSDMAKCCASIRIQSQWRRKRRSTFQRKRRQRRRIRNSDGRLATQRPRQEPTDPQRQHSPQPIEVNLPTHDDIGHDKRKCLSTTRDHRRRRRRRVGNDDNNDDDDENSHSDHGVHFVKADDDDDKNNKDAYYTTAVDPPKVNNYTNDGDPSKQPSQQPSFRNTTTTTTTTSSSGNSNNFSYPEPTDRNSTRKDVVELACQQISKSWQKEALVLDSTELVNVLDALDLFDDDHHHHHHHQDDCYDRGGSSSFKVLFYDAIHRNNGNPSFIWRFWENKG